MAAAVIPAIIDLYNSIAAPHFGGTRPAIYLNEAPQKDASGVDVRTPYVILTDDGLSPEFNSSYGGIEDGELKFEVFARKVSDSSGVTVSSIVAAIKYGGSSPATKAGIDFGAFTLTGYLYTIQVMRTREKYSYAGFLDHEGQRIHKCELVYRVLTGLKPTS